MSLDHLYSTEAMNINFGENDNKQTINVLDKFMQGNEHNLTITEGTATTGYGYDPETKTIYFNANRGEEFKKDLNKDWTEDNTGKNSASSVLGHEIIHGYNNEFDNSNYLARKAEKYDRSIPPYFPNKEEKYVTTNLANQVNIKLGQDKRTNYAIRRYYTISPTSTKKKP